MQSSTVIVALCSESARLKVQWYYNGHSVQQPYARAWQELGGMVGENETVKTVDAACQADRQWPRHLRTHGHDSTALRAREARIGGDGRRDAACQADRQWPRHLRTRALPLSARPSHEW